MPRSEPGAPWPLVRHGLRNVTPWAGSTTPPGSNTNPCSRPGNTAHNGAPPEPEGPGRYPSSQPFPQPCPHTYHHSVVPQTKARASSSLWRKARAGSPPWLAGCKQQLCPNPRHNTGPLPAMQFSCFYTHWWNAEKLLYPHGGSATHSPVLFGCLRSEGISV